MSGKNQTRVDGDDLDQRSQRTRRALLDSLIGLVHTRRYEDVAVGDIVQGARLGRSTFYDHYRGKDDMLVETMGPMLDVMADVAAGGADVAALEQVLRHFMDNRAFARQLFTSVSAREVSLRISRELALRIEVHLRRRSAGAPSDSGVTAALLAAQVAEAQFAWVRIWLFDDQACTPEALARAMQLTATGAIAALL